MSMPPSGLDGKAMDEEAVIEAEIQFELDNINLDEDQFVDDGGIGDLDPINGFNDADGFNGDLAIPNEIDDYIKRIQNQTTKFEEELEECDDLLRRSHQPQGTANLALIPYDDQKLLDSLAQEFGCSVEEYKKKILEDIEQDNFEITDELAEFIDEEDTAGDIQHGTNGDLLAITDGQGSNVANGEQDVKLENEIKKAVEEGVDPSEIPVSQDLLPANKQINGKTDGHLEIQKMLREQLEKLETRYEDRLEKLRKDEAFRKDEEEVREKRQDEERLWKKQELERENQKIKLDRELAERKIAAENSEAEKEFVKQTKQFERDMAQLQSETERQKKELEMAREEERKRQLEKQISAAMKIQSQYRGYSVRKGTTSVLKEKRVVRLKEKEEERIKEVEKEFEARDEAKKRKEDEERLRKEEEKNKQEEIKRQKELEKQQKEEEKKRKKEEEERKKQEEKRRKEEEKQRKKEEEKKRKEEEKKRKEEEEQRKKEEKRLKEEQEKQRKEEEKRRKEEEKRQKEEEKRRIEEEKKRKEEEKKTPDQENTIIENNGIEAHQTGNVIDKVELGKTSNLHTENGNKIVINNEKNKENKYSNELKSDSSKEKINQNDMIKEKTGVMVKEADSVSHIDKEQHLNDKNSSITSMQTQNISHETMKTEPDKIKKINTPRNVHVSGLDKQDQLDKLQQSGHIPHPPSPRKKTKSNLSKSSEDKPEASVDMSKIDCLPEQLESLRLKFMKGCQSWSKVSNEPWKLKTGLSRKPLRRPSSAKKLPLVPENVILQAAKVSSLQQVTTVQLSDLPGNNLSPLGQCWGLKYLSMRNCNLMAVDSLGQCKQLQYIDVRNNKIEYLDLKDVGKLQYLNVSHNRLSSIHGIDNCSSLRWLDLSHNNVTKLGGLDTLRRLNTLILSHNQLISADGLGATPTLQMIDMSHNHLQEINDIEKLCLLLSIDLSSNNLLMVPNFQNQVLLQDVNLSDNSISSLDEISTVWLPLLTNLNLSQNSLSILTSLQNCLTLKKLDLSNNQLIECDVVSKCVEGCLYLESLLLEDNPVIADLNDSSFKSLEKLCPRLQLQTCGTPRKQVPIKPKTSFEAMCLTQGQTYKDILGHFDISLKSTKIEDLASLCDLHHKYCEKNFNVAVEHRYAHEYGEVSVTMPMAPTTPKSGRPISGRQKETFASPKDMFENALRASGKPSNDVGANSHTKTSVATSLDPNPRDLFEQALKSAGSVPQSSSNTGNQSVKSNSAVTNGLDHGHQTAEEKRLKAIVTIQSYWKGWLVRHEIAEHTKIWLAATTIQACWRGYLVRKQLINSSSIDNVYRNLPPEVLSHLNKSAVKIQSLWRGYNLRRKLLAALEYAQCNFGDEEEEDEDAMMFGDDFDLDKFVSLDQNLLEDDWRPPETPEIPQHLPVLKRPPSGRAKIPPIPLNDHLQPPSNPRKAWRNAESPMTELSRPPSSLASTSLTARTNASRKEERLTEEWGFKDTGTAHLMMQRAKKMKYNAERRTKINKLDPKQRLALFRKLEEVTHPRTVPAPQRKTLPRKEYFKARQEEIYREDQEKQEEFNTKASRTFQWLHSQVGEHVVTDSVINKGFADGPKYVPENLPELQGIRRVQLVQSPGSIDLQSVESVSSAGLSRPRRSSAGTGSSSKLPPIQTSSAPTQHVKERMSIRNPKTNQSVGWGGGKKRGSMF